MKAVEGCNKDLTLKSTLLWAGGWSRWPQEASSSLNCYTIQRKRTTERKQLKMEVSLHEELMWRKVLLFTVKDTARRRKLAGNSFCSAQWMDFLDEILKTVGKQSVITHSGKRYHTENLQGWERYAAKATERGKEGRWKPEEFSWRPKRALEKYITKELKRHP